MLRRLALLGVAAPRTVVAVAALLMVGAGIYGAPVIGKLSAGGFYDPGSESWRANELLAQKFERSDTQLIVELTTPDGVAGAAARDGAAWVVDLFEQSPQVSDLTSAWTAPPTAAAGLVSRDGNSGLIVAGLRGGEDYAPGHAADLAEQVSERFAGSSEVSIRTGGTGMLKAEATEQTKHDLLRTEMIALPLSFLVLVWMFGGLLAAAVPMAVGLLAVAGSLSILRLIALFTEVSVFALNLTVALGLALAVDYTLLIINRYRDELAEDVPPGEALLRTMLTAGRTVLFSAVTVALSMSVMVIFPTYFLRSFAYAGIATAALAAVAAVVLTPAAIVALGPRIDALDARRLIRRILRRGEPEPKPIADQFWYRSAVFVTRRALPLGLAVVLRLIALGAPFLGIKWGYPDDRVLPASSATHQLGDRLRADYATNLETSISVVIPDVHRVTPQELDRYGAELSRVPDVNAVSTPSGSYVDGRRLGPPAGAVGVVDGSAQLTVDSAAPLFSEQSEAQLDRLNDVAGPDGRGVLMTGAAMVNRDSVDAIVSRLPMAGAMIAVIIFVLLFVLTGSVVLPIKAHRDVRRTRVDIPGRTSGCVWDHGDRNPGRQHPGDGVLYRVRAGHGL